MDTSYRMGNSSQNGQMMGEGPGEVVVSLSSQILRPVQGPEQQDLTLKVALKWLQSNLFYDS